MTLAIFGYGPRVDLPPSPPAGTTSRARPKRVPCAERPCAACGKAFTPCKDHTAKTCSRACVGKAKSAEASARLRAEILSALATEGQYAPALSGGRTDLVSAALRSLEADGLAVRSGDGRYVRWCAT